MTRFLSTAETAKLLGKTPRTIRRYWQQGRLVGHLPAGRLVFDPEENPEIKKRLEEDHDR
jgi:hypothetical protein